MFARFRLSYRLNFGCFGFAAGSWEAVKVASGERQTAAGAWDHGGSAGQVLGGSMACGPVGSCISALSGRSHQARPSNDGVGWDLGTYLKPPRPGGCWRQDA